MSTSRWRRGTAAAVLAAAVMTTAACGRGDTKEAAPPTTVHDHDAHSHEAPSASVDPCSLVTSSDLEVALGPGFVTSATGLPNMGVIVGSKTCAVSQASDKRLAVSLAVANGDGVTEKFDSYMDRFGKVSEPVAGLGDNASWVPIFRTLMVLQRDGRTVLSIQMLDPQEDTNLSRDKAVKLASAAMPRLTHG